MPGMTAKAEFLKQFGKDCGCPDAPKSIDEIRSCWKVLLGSSGATLYSKAQMEAVAKDLAFHVYVNPGVR